MSCLDLPFSFSRINNTHFSKSDLDRLDRFWTVAADVVVVFKLALCAPRCILWIAPISIARTSLFARRRDPSAVSDRSACLSDDETLSTEEFLRNTEGKRLALALENHDPPLLLCEPFLECLECIGVDVIYKVNLSELNVKYCCFGVFPLA